MYNQSVIRRNELCKWLEKFIGEEVTIRQIVVPISTGWCPWAPQIGEEMGARLLWGICPLILRNRLFIFRKLS